MTSDRHAPQGADQQANDPAQDAADHLTGRVLDGRYLIGSRIARGGMATVYEATDLRLDRTVAVKVMHPGLGDDDEFAARFVAEARAAAKLSHPNVVAVFDQGNDDGTVFLAMELIPGHTLRDTIGKEAPLSAARTLALLEPVVSALAAAHRAGLIHRDVKPENVLIADDGRIKVADFGLAKAMSATTQHTATGVLIGTVSYVAPELVVEGRSDARADVYAVGVILYELLTGKKPHEGETPIQVAYKHVHEDVPPPSRLVPGIPDYVDALVARATARDREQRPADAGVLLHHLRRVNQAVSAGVRSDPELVDDLLPRKMTDTAEVLRRQGPSRGDTSPEPWDHAAMAALLAPPREATTTIERPRVPTTVTERPKPAAADSSLQADEAATPSPARADPAGARAPGRGRGRHGCVVLRLRPLHHDAGGPAALPRGGAAAARGRRTRREDGRARVLRHGRRGTGAQHRPVRRQARPQGHRRHDHGLAGPRGRAAPEADRDHRGRGAGPDPQGQHGVRQGHQGATPRPCPRASSSPPTRRPARTLRFGTIVDLVVSKGREPIPVGSWAGKSADDAEEALQERGLKVDVSHQYSDHRRRGHRRLPGPEERHPLQGRHGHPARLSRPRAGRGPRTSSPHGVDDATATLQAAGFVVDVEEAPGYIGLGYVFSMDPAAGTELPKGSTVIIYLV